jgi:hypothetical protein
MKKDLPAAPGVPAPAGRVAAPGKAPDDLAEPGTPRHREQIVGAFMTVMGMKREAAEAKYDQQLAQWRLEQGGG